MKEINISTWKRRSHYELFSKYTNPSFRIDTRLDMTSFMKYKPESDGFFAPFLYLLMTAANMYEGFKIRYLDGKLVLFDTVSPSYTVLLENENFAFKSTEYTSSYPIFASTVKEDLKTAKNLALTENGDAFFQTNNRADLIYISCLPWIDFISTENPLPYEDKMSMSIPRFNWGKCVKEGQSYKMTLSITLNHGYIDGYEASMMLVKLQEMLDNCKDYFQTTT